MKRKKINISAISSALSRSEMRKIMAGSDQGGGSGGGCSGNWTIHPACNPYNGSSPNAIICFVPNGPDRLICNPAPGTNPQTACCG